MRTIILAAAAVVLLTGCGNDAESDSPDQMFLSKVDGYWKSDEAKAIEAAHLACDRMRAGAKLNAIAQLADGRIGAGGFIEADAANLRRATDFVAAAATAYCPEQLTMAPTGIPPTAAATTTAPVSSGSEVADLAFIATLTKRGITYSSRNAAITLGRAVCNARQAGNTAAAVALTIAEKGYSIEDAGYIVGAAQSAYCPQYN